MCEADVKQIVLEMGSADERTRARAVRRICPCRISWEAFSHLRQEAKRLQNDASPLVRANALHIEKDFDRVLYNEARFEEIEEQGGESRSRRRRGARILRSDSPGSF
ncbi:MAG TPA: hypothetical protein VGM43_25575 [Bryobacteraceae bacterium]